jgi:DHA3 family macrolide efflux protein-like MFS transporter
MVKKEDLSRVGGMNQALQGLVAIAIPPFAAVLLELMPIQSILMIDVGTAVIAVLPLLVYSIPKQEMMQDVMTLSSIYSDFREGLSFIWRWTGMMYITIMVLLLKIMLIPAFSLLPLYIKDYFGGGAIEYAWIQSANGIGLVVGGLFLGAWGGFEKKIMTAMGAYAFAGAGLVAFGMVPSGMFVIGVASVFLFSMVISVGDASFFAMLQASIPPEMQGRVLMILMSLGAATGPIGLVIAGPLSDLYGIKMWFLGAGIVLGLISLTALFAPAILRVEKGPTLK